eukprot:m.188109 g.188109  ORF g.188109 m.188109 type:complete len:301 (-) comp24811_c0_seq4:384-1286(-)
MYLTWCCSPGVLQTVTMLLLGVLLGGMTTSQCGSCGCSGFCPSGGTVGDFNTSVLGLDCAPTGNPPDTKTTFSIQGRTSAADQREFLVNLGLVSSTGANSRPTPYHDKVTLYAGMLAENGTGDVWAINPLLTMGPSSGDYNAQGIELDFNNRNAHRGDADAGGGLAPPVACVSESCLVLYRPVRGLAASSAVATARWAWLTFPVGMSPTLRVAGTACRSPGPHRSEARRQSESLVRSRCGTVGLSLPTTVLCNRRFKTWATLPRVWTFGATRSTGSSNPLRHRRIILPGRLASAQRAHQR